MDDKIKTDKALAFIEAEIMPALRTQLNNPSSIYYTDINIKSGYHCGFLLFNKVFKILKEKGFYPSFAYKLKDVYSVYDSTGDRVLRIKW
jgi:hypothetical protein